MNCMIETAIAVALFGTPAAFMAGGFRFTDAMLAGLFALLALAFLYLAFIIGCCL